MRVLNCDLDLKLGDLCNGLEEATICSSIPFHYQKKQGLPTLGLVLYVLQCV